MNDSMRKWLRRVGVELTRFPGPSSLEWQIRDLIQHRSIDAVVDVGAHEGEFARLIRDVVRFAGPIASFEPMRASFDALTRTMADDPSWTGHRLALGAESGELELNVFAATVFNSFRTPNAIGHQLFSPELKAQSTETVQLRRLDEVLDLPGTLLLKTDTQGFDLDVIEGAKGVLDRVAGVVVELPVRPIYTGSPDLVEMLGWMKAHGYEVLGLFPVTRDTEYFRVVEFDGVFVKDHAPAHSRTPSRTSRGSPVGAPN